MKRMMAFGAVVLGLAALPGTAVLAAGKAVPSSGLAGQTASDLWGNSGERWQAGSRLPDFSFAGYHRGETGVPSVPVKTNVKDHGAKGDGNTDDTKAIQAAIAATTGGAVYLPAGRYKITDFISIRKAGVVLRGAGPDSTTLWFPLALNTVHPDADSTSTGTPTTAYSFDYGYLTLQGDFGSTQLTAISAVSKRGDSSVTVASTAKLNVGRTVMIRLHEDAAQSLKTFLYSGDPGDITSGKPLGPEMVLTVTSVQGNRIHFNRPLRFDTRAEWTPEVLAYAPTVTESGIEDLRCEFPAVPYPGHFKELGFNAIELRTVSDCWVRNVRIHNADMGILMAEGACFNTAERNVHSAYAERGSLAGHHAYQLKRSTDNLVTRFDMQVRYVHDLSVENASGNVYGNGKGVDVNFDHHEDTPFENLYTDIDMGAGTRPWESGGGAGLGRHSAGWETFWNIRSNKDIPPPPADWGPATLNLVAIRTAAAAIKQPEGKWLEPIPPADITPPDIRVAQLARRLSMVGIRKPGRRGSGASGKTNPASPARKKVDAGGRTRDKAEGKASVWYAPIQSTVLTPTR
jgi:Pectate lyase superfamily protein